MQDLNEDPDEQFRVAVDKITLKPADSRWNEMSGKIISIKRSSLADTIRSKYRKWMMLLVLFILLPVALFFLVPGFNGIHKVHANGAGTVVQKNTTENVNQKTNSSKKSDSQTTEPVTGSSQVQSVAQGSAQTGTTTQSKSDAREAAQTGLSGLAQSVTEIASKNQPAQSNYAWTDPGKKEYGLDVFDAGSSVFSEPSSKPMVVGLALSDALSFAPIDSKAGSLAFDKKEIASLTLQSNTQKNLPLQHLDMPRRQGFYLGLVGGPLLTEVKNQGLKKSGFDLGLLAGYTLSKKFSIETGVLYTHQYYYVSGKYYNEFAGINNAASLEGSRNAFEIPLTLKYNFIRKTGRNFYIAAGASTFVGVSDKVVIQVAEGTIPPSAHFDYGVTSYLPAYVNISLGYEYKLGKSADIRLEPYFQIPLNSNTGNSFKTESSGGSIQVFNAGIHIVISRFIR